MNSAQRTARHFLVLLMRPRLAGNWYFGISCARGKVAAAPVGRCFGLDELHGMGLVCSAPGKGRATIVLALAS